MAALGTDTKMMGMFVDGASELQTRLRRSPDQEPCSPKSSFSSHLASSRILADVENRLPAYTTKPNTSHNNSRAHERNQSGSDHKQASFISSANPQADLSHPSYQAHFGPHRGSSSTTTSISESTDSSPTTTISTTDSVSITDPSPSSSPDSHITIVPLSSFTSKNMTGHDDVSDELTLSPPISPFPAGYQQSMSPGKRPRNMKNLSLNMSMPNRAGAPRPSLQVKTASLLDGSLSNSAPPSPSFQFPMKPPMKKRPSKLGLSIQTPSTSFFPGLYESTNRGLRIAPPTPSFHPSNTLRHHASSPSLSLFSPTTGVQGGMQLPPFNAASASAFHRPKPLMPVGTISRHSSVDSNSTSSEHVSPDLSTRLSELEEEDDYDPPLSQEIKSPAYPEGPVCIFEPLVFLYLEPTAVEAQTFDVIFNVAREVKNPFVTPDDVDPKTGKASLSQASTPSTAIHDRMRTVSEDEEMMEPGSTTSMASFRTAFEDLAEPEAVSPTTPKATVIGHPSSHEPASATGSTPEYVHMRWDHNTAIVDDLFTLVEIIDDRVRRGKRILIHCQCGVSRSASLIVAYGLYKNPALTVQEAYDTVKSRSRWIGPNMSLIYQLSEFRTKLLKKSGGSQLGPRNWRNAGGMIGGVRSNTLPGGNPIKRPSLCGESFDDAQTGRSEPLTAPLPDERDCGIGHATGDSKRDVHHLSPHVPALMSGLDKLGVITPGPSSAPPGMSWLSDSAMERFDKGLTGGSPWGASGMPRSSHQEAPQMRRSTEIPTSHPLPSPTRRTPLDSCSLPKAPSLSSISSLSTKRSRGNLHIGTRIDPPLSISLPSNNSIHAFNDPRGPFTDDIPPTPSLLSPRAIEFTANPFHPAPALAPISVIIRGANPNAAAATTASSNGRSNPASGPLVFGAMESDVRAAASSCGFSTSAFDSVGGVLSPTAITPMRLPSLRVKISPQQCLQSGRPSISTQGQAAVQGGLANDPRSPVQRGEAPIVRSIFDVL